MKLLKKLPDVDELKHSLPLSNEQKTNRENRIVEIQKILSGKSNKKLLVIGPCSADDEKAVLEYVCKLAKVAEDVSDSFLIVPRIYTGKPRTTGCGYKGLLHKPDASTADDDICGGIEAMRKLHLRVIEESGLYGADEILYPEAVCYIDDLLVYAAIGARSVENQQHRLVSSGLEFPVGMKNPTSGDNEVMLNAITAAQNSQAYMYHGWECRSDGNPYAHAILRGYADLGGRVHSNYHYENLIELHDTYVEHNLKNIGVIIDCNHSNSRKHYDEQVRISKEVLHLCQNQKGINQFVKGFMIESYLKDGAQMIDEGIYGKSITDPCLGWAKTEKLIYEMAEMIN